MNKLFICSLEKEKSFSIYSLEKEHTSLFISKEMSQLSIYFLEKEQILYLFSRKRTFSINCRKGKKSLFKL